MRKIIAKCSFWYRGKEYKNGDEVECDDPEMIQAWKRSGAIQEEAEEDAEAGIQEEAEEDAEAGIQEEAEEDAESGIQEAPEEDDVSGSQEIPKKNEIGRKSQKSGTIGRGRKK